MNDPLIIPQPTPAQLTPTQEVMKNIETINTRIYTVMLTGFKEIYDSIWNPVNPNVTAQNIFDAMGTNAAQFLQDAELMVSLILSVDPTFTPPQPLFPLTINADGTITVNYPAPVDPTVTTP